MNKSTGRKIVEMCEELRKEIKLKKAEKCPYEPMTDYSHAWYAEKQKSLFNLSEALYYMSQITLGDISN